MIGKCKVKAVVGITLVTVILVLSSFSAVLAEVEWRKFAGTTIRVVSYGTPYSEAARMMIPEFEKKTGIKVNWEVYGAWQMREKTGIELVSHAPDLDVLWYQVNERALWFWKGGHLADITKFINDPTLTPADWDWEDFSPTVRNILKTNPPSEAYGVPVGASGPLFWHRTDLLSESGIPVPQTFEELEEAAAKLHSTYSSKGVVGWAARGAGSQAVWTIPPWLYSFGGAFFTRDRESALGKPESVRAIELYGRMLREYGPPNPIGVGWLEVNDLFRTGKAAMIEVGSDSNAIFMNPDESSIVGKWAADPMPAGPAGRFASVTIHALGISEWSAHKEAAWLFIQWLNNKENTLKLLMAGWPIVRESAWQDPRFAPETLGPGWVQAITQYHQFARNINRPWVINVEEARAEMGKIIEASIKGEPLDSVIQQVADNLRELQKRDGSIDLPINPDRVYMPTTVWR